MMQLAPSDSLPHLAAAEIAGMGVAQPSELEYAGTLSNLCVAHRLGQLQRDIEDDRLTGFVAWMRLTLEQLLEVARLRVRLFRDEDNTAGGAVLFVTEQLNLAGPAALRHRFTTLENLPGVQCVAGWRGERLRVRGKLGPTARDGIMRAR